jgi:hypothetical protein
LLLLLLILLLRLLLLLLLPLVAASRYLGHGDTQRLRPAAHAPFQ